MEPTLRDRTILVTGGAGFVGSCIAETLAPANEVRVLDDLTGGSVGNVPAGAELIEGDIRNAAHLDRAMRDVDIVFHQAAMVDVTESVRQPRTCHEINATGTVEVLECARRADARVVFASSAAVYGNPESTPIPETASLDPTSPYGGAKLAAETQAAVYTDRYDLPTVSLRYFNVYGPRQSRDGPGGVVATFLRQAARGARLTINGDGEQTRDFVHVSDVVRANLLAATTDHVGEAFNIGTGETVTINQLAAHVRSVTDSDVPVVHTEQRAGDIRHSCADITKARDRLDYDPEIELAEGLRSIHECDTADATVD